MPVCVLLLLLLFLMRRDAAYVFPINIVLSFPINIVLSCSLCFSLSPKFLISLSKFLCRLPFPLSLSHSCCLFSFPKEGGFVFVTDRLSDLLKIMGSEMDSYCQAWDVLKPSIFEEYHGFPESKMSRVLALTREQLKELDRTIKKGDHIVTSRWFGPIKYDHHGIYAGEGKVIHFQAPRKNCDDLCKCHICGYQQTMEGKVVQSCINCFARGKPVHKLEYKVPIAWEIMNSNTTKSLIPGKAIRAYKRDKFYLRMYKDGELYGHVQISEKESAKYGIDDGVYCYEHASAKSHVPVIETAQRLLRDGFAKYNLVFRNCEDFATYCTTGISKSTQVKKWVPTYESLKSVHRHFQMVEKKRELLTSLC